MTSSIPDSISKDALLRLQVNAEPDFVPNDTSMADATPKEQVDRVIDAVEALSDEWGTIFSYKLIADYCLHQMFEHHKEVSQMHFKDGEQEHSFGWSHDAGQIQAASRILRGIQCGDKDFLTPTQN